MRYRARDTLTPADVGRRVTVRRALPEGGTTDVLGVLLAAEASSVTVERKDGTAFEIAREDIVAARVHPTV